jgi:hypothetical protein
MTTATTKGHAAADELTVNAASRFVKRSTYTILKAIANGELSTILRPGSLVRVKKADLIRLFGVVE